MTYIGYEVDYVGYRRGNAFDEQINARASRVARFLMVNQLAATA